jgi:hypothetical protein
MFSPQLCIIIAELVISRMGLPSGAQVIEGRRAKWNMHYFSIGVYVAIEIT